MRKSNQTAENSERKKQQCRTEIKEIREAFEKSGAQGYWRRWLETQKRRPLADTNFNFIAILHANVGEKENALDALEKAVERKDSDVGFMKVEPSFDTRRAAPRFQMLLRRINLEP